MNNIARYQTEMLEANKHGLRDGLEFTFRALKDSIVDRDMSTLSQICEGNLQREFEDFFEDCEDDGYTMVH